MKTEEVIKYIKELNEVDCACVVGSYNHNKDAKNIDIILVTNEPICNIVERIGEFINLPSSVSDDTIQFKNCDGKTFSFLIHSSKELDKKVNEIVSGNNHTPRICEWAIIGWLPESFLNDLQKMVIIKDREDYLSNLKENLGIYPESLKTAIIDFSTKKIKYLKMKQECFSNNVVESKIIQAEIVVHEIRKKYAEENRYLHSFSSITKEGLYEE